MRPHICSNALYCCRTGVGGYYKDTCAFRLMDAELISAALKKIQRLELVALLRLLACSASAPEFCPAVTWSRVETSGVKVVTWTGALQDRCSAESPLCHLRNQPRLLHVAARSHQILIALAHFFNFAFREWRHERTGNKSCLSANCGRGGDGGSVSLAHLRLRRQTKGAERGDV